MLIWCEQVLTLVIIIASIIRLEILYTWLMRWDELLRILVVVVEVQIARRISLTQVASTLRVVIILLMRREWKTWRLASTKLNLLLCLQVATATVWHTEWVPTYLIKVPRWWSVRRWNRHVKVIKIRHWNLLLHPFIAKADSHCLILLETWLLMLEEIALVIKIMTDDFRILAGSGLLSLHYALRQRSCLGLRLWHLSSGSICEEGGVSRVSTIQI